MKKTLTVYSMLFLFAFTFALSFTLATPARADNCCVYDWCGDPENPYVGAWGHWIWIQGEGFECEIDFSSDCDTVYSCWHW